AVQFLDRQADEAAPAIAAGLFGATGARRIVAAGAKGAVAGPGEHDDADRAVLLGIAHRAEHLLDGLGAERVQHLRAVDRDRRDPVALLVKDVLECHDRGPSADHPVAGSPNSRRASTRWGLSIILPSRARVPESG